jgi:hypothetical protein
MDFWHCVILPTPEESTVGNTYENKHSISTLRPILTEEWMGGSMQFWKLGPVPREVKPFLFRLFKGYFRILGKSIYTLLY